MQLGKPEPLPGSLDKGDAFLQRRFRARHIACPQQGFGNQRDILGLPDMAAGLAPGCCRSVYSGDIFFRRFARRARAGMENRTK